MTTSSEILMDSGKQAAVVPFEEAVLKAQVAQICESVGYHAITQDSSNILVDIYRRTIHHLARHCKDAANNNRRVEPTIIDLIQAYDFVGISIPELQEHIETVKLPLNIEITQDESKPSKGIQRDLLVDDLLEAEKNSHLEELDDGEKAMSESGIEEDEKPSVPLLKDTYEEISKKFSNCVPVTADKKIKLSGRIVFVANTKLKISAPVPPEPEPSTSKSGKLGKKKAKRGVERKKKGGAETSSQTISPVKQTQYPTTNVEASSSTPEARTPQKVRGPAKRKLKTAVTPLDPSIAEPPSFFPILEHKDDDQAEINDSTPQPTPTKTKTKQTKGKKRKLKPSETTPSAPEPSTSNAEGKSGESGKLGKKKAKRGMERKKKAGAETIAPTISPVKPTQYPATSVEAPSSTPEIKEPQKVKGPAKKKLKTAVTPLDPSIAEPPSFFPILERKDDEQAEIDGSAPQPTPAQTKQTKGKKKKKSNNQFAIVTETVTAAEEKEWFCPACGGPDDGDLMVQCDSCQEWYHLGCTDLKKPPEDDENWECDICINKAKAQKKAPTPVIEVIKMKTPEPVVKTPSPPPPPVVAPGTSQDDLCPECNLPDDGTMMIQCDDPFCAKWFHGKCVNLLEEPKEDESWFCKVCVDKQQSAFKRRRRAK